MSILYFFNIKKKEKKKKKEPEKRRLFSLDLVFGVFFSEEYTNK